MPQTVPQTVPQGVATPQRELIHPQHAGHRDGRIGQSTEQPRPTSSGPRPRPADGPAVPPPGRPAPKRFARGASPSPTLHHPERTVGPGTCSAKVFFWHSSSRRQNRRTPSRITVSRPGIAVSDSRRSARLCTHRDAAPQPGQTASGPGVLALLRTDLPARNTPPMRTRARRGNQTASNSGTDTRHDHDQPSPATRSRNPSQSPFSAVADRPAVGQLACAAPALHPPPERPAGSTLCGCPRSRPDPHPGLDRTRPPQGDRVEREPTPFSLDQVRLDGLVRPPPSGAAPPPPGRRRLRLLHSSCPATRHGQRRTPPQQPAWPYGRWRPRSSGPLPTSPLSPAGHTVRPTR